MKQSIMERRKLRGKIRKKRVRRKEVGKKEGEEKEEEAGCSVPVRAMLPGDHCVNHLEVSRLGRHALGSLDGPTPHLPLTVDFYNFMETCTCGEECAGSDSSRPHIPGGSSRDKGSFPRARARWRVSLGVRSGQMDG